MTVIKKLSELHKEAFLHLLDTGKPFTHENYAVFLLANGVIVPPCKPGQTVYVMESEFTGFTKYEIVSMLYDGVQWFGNMNSLWKHHHGGYTKWQEAEFGKTIFFTQEEAEKALKLEETEEE